MAKDTATIIGVTLGGSAVLVGLYLMYRRKKGVKKAGEKVTCRIKFKHSGPGGQFWVGFALAPAKTPHERPNNIPPDMWFGDIIDIGSDPKTGKWYTHEVTGVLPEVKPGKYDGLRVIHMPQSPPPYHREYDDDWDDDVYTIA